MRTTKKQKLYRKEKYKSIDFEINREKSAIRKLINKEMHKTDSKLIRIDKANALTQSISNDKSMIYELLCEKMEVRAEELANLILDDLGVNENPDISLTPNDIYEVMAYYENKGLNQIKNAIPEEEMSRYMSTKMTPYQKMFKNLIAKRAEFIIVAPKERLNTSLPYTKIKDEEMKKALVKHLAELNIIQNFNFAKKFPSLRKLYEDLKENSMEVKNEKMDL